MTVPFIVAAGPPAEMVVPTMVNAVGFGVNVWLAITYTLLEGRRSMVELPIANEPDGPRLIAVPSTIIAGPPAEMTVPAMEKAEGFGVKVWPATANTGVADVSIREMVLLSMARTPD